MRFSTASLHPHVIPLVERVALICVCSNAYLNTLIAHVGCPRKVSPQGKVATAPTRGAAYKHFTDQSNKNGDLKKVGSIREVHPSHAAWR